MPPPAKKPLLRPRQQTIDIYNSISTGHQVGSGVSKPTSWRKSRSSKLQQQFQDHPHSLFKLGITPETMVTVTATGSITVASTALKSPHAPGKPKLGEGNPSVTEPVTTQAGTSDPPQQQDPTNEAISLCTHTGPAHTHTISSTATSTAPALNKPTPTTTATKVFTNCTIYVNGTTAPAISDLVLKRLLCTHGASIATMLARRSVTHVILGKPSSAGGAGGGLAAGKLQKELKNGKSIKFVSVQWALDSVKAGKRLSEANYAVINMHSQSQRNIKGFAKAPPAPTANTENTDKVIMETIKKVDYTTASRVYTKVSD
ncbi:hypothetical protein BGX38DRAFT_1264311 [Terfezia claveryi]|nr:hypothetical protein BGX38DRAFT_1264311 [Terfezia claveryi]